MEFDGITTKTGDDGLTGLLGGERVSKDNCLIEAMGAQDELCAWLGLLKAEVKQGQFAQIDVTAELEDIQRELFKIGAELAVAHDSPLRNKIKPLEKTAIERLERYEKTLMGHIELPRDFIIPGSSVLSAKTDITRSVARRLECSAVRVRGEYPARLRSEIVIPYLNRLSDYLFALARFFEQNAEQE